MLPVIMLTASEGSEKTAAIEAQAAELLDLNRTLEERVRTQLDELERRPVAAFNVIAVREPAAQLSSAQSS